MRALCDGARPVGVRALAFTANRYWARLRLGGSWNLFHREELCERTSRGAVVEVHVARLIRRWAPGLPLLVAWPSVAVAHPRASGALGALRDATVPYALTAQARLPCSAPRCRYVDNPERVASAMAPRRWRWAPPTWCWSIRSTASCSTASGGIRRAAITHTQIIAELFDSPPPAASQAATLLGDAS